MANSTHTHEGDTFKVPGSTMTVEELAGRLFDQDDQREVLVKIGDDNFKLFRVIEVELVEVAAAQGAGVGGVAWSSPRAVVIEVEPSPEHKGIL